MPGVVPHSNVAHASCAREGVSSKDEDDALTEVNTRGAPVVPILRLTLLVKSTMRGRNVHHVVREIRSGRQRVRLRCTTP